MSELAGLLERVTAATGPDRELDEAVWLMFDPAAPGAHANGKVPLPWLWLVTSSIDAALALTERVLPETMRRISDLEDGNGAKANLVLADGSHHWADADTMPLAILAATLSALIAKETP